MGCLFSSRVVPAFMHCGILMLASLNGEGFVSAAGTATMLFSFSNIIMSARARCDRF